MLHLFRFTWLCALVLSLTDPANSATIAFSNKASFLAFTGATPEAPIPNLGVVPSPTTVGNLQYSLGPGGTALYMGTGSPVIQWSTLLGGHEIAISAFEDLNVVDIAMSVHAIGWDFHEPSISGTDGTGFGTDRCNAACVDSTFAVTLLSLGLPVGSFSFNAADDVAAFAGVYSTLPFDRVEIRETTGGIDNEFYGQFYTAVNAVPEPLNLALAGTGLAVVFTLRRRRK
jgi:hypothetical protein